MNKYLMPNVCIFLASAIVERLVFCEFSLKKAEKIMNPCQFLSADFY